jgi:hypothetical protein
LLTDPSTRLFPFPVFRRQGYGPGLSFPVPPASPAAALNGAATVDDLRTWIDGPQLTRLWPKL